jgi:hypothetical protein
MNAPMVSVADATRRRRRTAGGVTSAGLAVLAAAALVAWSWREELPDPVATHWGVGGVPDGFSSLNAAVAVLLGIGVVLVLGFGGITLSLGQSAVTRRIGAAATIWSALFLSLLTLGTLNVQRGLADAHEAGGVGGALVVAVVGSLVPALIAGLLVAGDPLQPTSEPVAADAPRAASDTGEGSTWVGRAESGPAIWVGLAAVALVLALVVVTRLWALLIVVGVVAVLVASMCAFVVRVDATGLTVRSVLGWPRLRVPLEEVVRADVAQVRPLPDFGGWGLRVGRGGRVGVVLRRGEALLVQRTGGRSVVVTVDDAERAAGLLNSIADQSRHA